MGTAKPRSGAPLQRLFGRWLESEGYIVHLVRQGRVQVDKPYRRWINLGEDLFGCLDFLAFRPHAYSIWGGNLTTVSSLSGHKREIEQIKWPKLMRVSIVIERVEPEYAFLIYDLITTLHDHLMWQDPRSISYNKQLRSTK